MYGNMTIWGIKCFIYANTLRWRWIVLSASRGARESDNSFLNSDIVESAIYDPNLMENYLVGIAQNIQIEMDRRNISLRKLAEISDINPSHLCKVLSHKSHIGLTTLIKISCGLGVRVNDLLPTDTNKRKTNGDKFDDLTKALDVQIVNLLLGFLADFVRLNRRIKDE